MVGMTVRDGPLPASPMKGEVKSRVCGSIVPDTRCGTSPFMGEDGRGPSLTVVYLERANA
jgi:hypothetical protein